MNPILDGYNPTKANNAILYIDKMKKINNTSLNKQNETK